MSGLLLELAAGFIDSGLRDSLGLGESERSRVRTPLGDAVRLSYAPRPGTPVTVAWVIGAPRGTLLISTMGVAGAPGGMDPEAIVSGLQVTQ